VVAVVLALIGSQAAHSLDYWFVAPEPHAHAELLARTGHGYLEQLPFAVGCGVALIVVALCLRVLEGARVRRAQRLSYSLFALVPPLSFALQEHLERWFHDGSFPWQAVREPTFGLGLLLTLPFGLLAFVVARALLSFAEAFGRRCGFRRTPPASEEQPAEPVPSAEPERPRIPVLALRAAKRGPPAFASS
jgi:hypothetical protein